MAAGGMLGSLAASSCCIVPLALLPGSQRSMDREVHAACAVSALFHRGDTLYSLGAAIGWFTDQGNARLRGG